VLKILLELDEQQPGTEAEDHSLPHPAFTPVA
jgi:hypothetical protein